jgi:PhnB protein
MSKRIPDRCHTITPYLVVKDAARAIEFYGKAFGAMELCRMVGPDGTSIVHAELMIGDSVIFLAGAFSGLEFAWVGKGQWPTVSLHLYVQDCDRVFKQAVSAGCEVVMPLENMFWGDRYGKLRDPFGHQWAVATHVEDVSAEEMANRAAKMFGGHDG